MKVSVIVHPNSKKERIEEDLLDNLHIYVNQPPLEGKANKATISALAKHFNVKIQDVNLISGNKSKYKIFDVSNIMSSD